MRTLFAIVALLGSVSAQAAISQSFDLPLPSSQIELTDAEYMLIPTRTEQRRIPGCNPNGEIMQDCTETIVLESRPVIRVNISYVDGIFYDDSGKRWAHVDFRPSDFNSADVAALEAAYPRWRHPFSNAGRRFAAKNLEMTVQKVARTIQVVDVQRSHICRTLETGETEPGCVENIVYKPATSAAKQVTVTTK